MVGAALASILHVAGCPSPSHHCRPIVVIQLPLSYHRPQNAAVVIINIVSIGSGSGIVTITMITIAVIAAVSAIAVVAVIVDVPSTTLLCHRCITVLFGGQSEELDHTTPPQTVHIG